MEIMGDILKVVSDGSARPTQIMHGANLTWPPLMLHLEMLLRKRLLTRETDGDKSTYRVTPKGRDVLRMYLTLREETGVLESFADELEKEGVHRPGARRMLSNLRSILAAANFHVLENKALGKSGTEYTFPLVVQGMSRSRYGFVVLPDVDEQTVIRNFVKQLDTEVDLSIVGTGRISEQARNIAAMDSIPLLSTSDLAGFGESLTFRDAFRAASALILQVDPTGNYERVIEALVRREATNGHVFVFTLKQSRVYPAIPRLGMVTVRLMPETGSAEAWADVIGLLEGPADATQSEGRRLVILDDVSELLAPMGHAKRAQILKSVVGAAGASVQRSLFILKRDSKGGEELEFERGGQGRLVYDGDGLRLSPQ